MILNERYLTGHNEQFWGVLYVPFVSRQENRLNKITAGINIKDIYLVERVVQRHM